MAGGEESTMDCEEFVADCRIRAATDLFAHTWDPVVLMALTSGPRRRRELREAIGGVSDKVLTQALHRLLASGLIDRRAHAEAPPRVEYGLTGLGQSLVDGPLRALGRWVQDHGDELADAQERSVRDKRGAEAQRGGQARRAASAMAWSSSRPTPLAACTAMPKTRVVT
ncbi:helix-turn-helix domain-containing protein [Nonomuraea sp. MCN248]|uniref:Helix-turn-helix domain-containing protein n=1 Tax=Nonomuraea corallina TaxID=2989783 RepID=A0ABT4SBJ7_9ACTN|nr:helix-turn-helix domain-containing protein [Nonomuraea corallina]MDA0634576.1 helix-turn-helix domain-containing protein [Nonomuraea corallina]